VCTGNVCRSPYVAARLSAELPELTVASAGTGALVGDPPTAPTIALLAERGIEVSGASARAIDRASVRGARLLITAERRHRVDVARLAPDAAERTYTLLELARILQGENQPRGLGVAGVLALANEVVSRGEDRDFEDDLADPYGRSDQDYRAMASAADVALSVVVPALRAVDARG
jgi:protein-tyrosine phosphatase